MRCIEINENPLPVTAEIRLIETWDVLKSGCTADSRRGYAGLIETWDVLK